MKFPAWINPASVQVDAGQVAPRGAVYDTIYVQHRHNFEHEVVAKDLRIQRGPRQVVNHSLHHPRGSTLTRVHSRRNANAFPLFDCLGVTLEGGHDEHVTVVACNGLAQCASSHSVFPLRVTFQLVQVSLQVGVSVRVRMSQVDDILVMLKCYAPCQGVVIPSILPLHRVLVVADVAASASPAETASPRLRL